MGTEEFVRISSVWNEPSQRIVQNILIYAFTLLLGISFLTTCSVWNKRWTPSPPPPSSFFFSFPFLVPFTLLWSVVFIFLLLLEKEEFSWCSAFVEFLIWKSRFVLGFGMLNGLLYYFTRIEGWTGAREMNA